MSAQEISEDYQLEYYCLASFELGLTITFFSLPTYLVQHLIDNRASEF